MGRFRPAAALVAAGISLALGAGHAIGQDDTGIRGTEADDTLVGTSGEDAIYGRGGNDRMEGLDGDDTLDGGPGADLIVGGGGRDAVVYTGDAPVSVSLDDVGNDGAPGESDDVRADVEDIYTSAGGDVLTGSPLPNTLDGGPGNDRLTGGPGQDALVGDEGDDTIISRDNGTRDIVDCGGGEDNVSADAEDTVANCETVDLPPVVDADVLVAFTRLKRQSGLKAIRLTATDVPPGATVTLTCRGVSCPSRRARRITTRSATVVPLVRYVGGRRLRPGTAIRVVVSYPGRRSFIREFRIFRDNYRTIRD